MTRVLIVEDDELSRLALKRRLENSGFEVLVAVDGAEGVAKARSQRPDVILLDMGLPVLDGFEAARQLKSSPDTWPIPIIAVTAYAVTWTQEKCAQVGCDDFETKPVNFPVLLMKMQALMQQKKALG